MPDGAEMAVGPALSISSLGPGWGMGLPACLSDGAVGRAGTLMISADVGHLRILTCLSHYHRPVYV